MQKTITRRAFIKASALGFGSALIASGLNVFAKTEDLAERGQFLHGVASGDPLHDAVIIWTRFTPQQPSEVTLLWEVALDENFSHYVAAGTVKTNPDLDYTVKIDVQGLNPDTRYFYRFQCQEQVSPVGATQTLPKHNLEQLTLAAISCSNYPAGYFHVYQAIAQQENIDFVLHLGDYIYEYGDGEYATQKAQELNRIPQPPYECITLADYRQRYQQYRGDPQLQLLHQKKAMIAVWDDHEIADDAYSEGAKNHQEYEGDYHQRRLDALRAYFEWMPIRPASQLVDIYRRFQFGDLVDLFMLETRHIARSQHLQYENYLFRQGLFDFESFWDDVWDPRRTLLGDTQKSWLFDHLSTSTAKWQVLGQQVVMNQMHLPMPVILGDLAISQYYRIIEAFRLNKQKTQGLTLSEGQSAWLTPHQHLVNDNNASLLSLPKVPYNLDAWDGFAAERDALLQQSKQQGNNLIVLSGDTHNAWAGRLTTHKDPQHIVGYEFTTPSVSSPGLESYLNLNNWSAFWLAEQIKNQVPTLDYANISHRGYLKIHFTQTQTQATWHLTQDTQQPVFEHCTFDQHTLTVAHQDMR